MLASSNGRFQKSAFGHYHLPRRSRQATAPAAATPTTANMADTVTGDDRASANLAVKEVSATVVTGPSFA